MNSNEAAAEAIAYELQDQATYKPGHTLHFSAVGDRIVFHLDARVNDSLHGTPNTAIAYTYVIPVELQDRSPHTVDATLRHVAEQVRQALHKFEIHEADEWFQINGEQVHPPHRHYPTETQ